MLNLKIPNTKHLGNIGHYEKTKPKYRNRRQFKGTENIFNKLIEENFINLKKDI